MDGGFDDVRVLFMPSSDDDVYRVVAWDSATNHHAEGTFVVPSEGVAVARLAFGGQAPDVLTRDIGAAQSWRPEAEVVGARLANALFDGAIGTLYADALRRADATPTHGVRLCLSLGQVPRLLALPWELLFLRPRFLASQRQTPIVRVVEGGPRFGPSLVEGPLRILGVTASPSDAASLDVAAERRQIEQAISAMIQRGLVSIDWLEHASPDTLRGRLRSSRYHVLHFVGHSDLVEDTRGVILLERADGSSHLVDETLLANLLSDQLGDLGLVVLNSCHGASTTTADARAGVAASLLGLGVPAVVAMQFAITDAAAITFAGTLYSDLLEQRSPIDIAVAEARKAIYGAVSDIEWATPVLFLRDPGAPLFRFTDPPPREDIMPSRVAATSVMPLLVAHATGTPSGQTSEVWASVAACFARKPDAAAALQRLVDRPEDPRRAGAVEDYLEEILDADPSFAGALAAILEEDSAVINPAPTIITDAGAVAFGNLHINAGRDAAGRDLTVESASSEATSRRRWRRRRNNP